MANTIISLENVSGRWVGEVEVGSPVSRRSVIRADSFETAITQIKAAYDGFLELLETRAIFSGGNVEQVQAPAALPDTVLDPENNSPKLPRGRHKASCNCPRCTAKKLESTQREGVADEVAAL